MKNENRTELFENYPVSKAVAKMALPTVVSQLVTIIYSLSDTAFVGMLGDPVQNAAVTLASTVTLAFYAVTNLFGVGSSSMMSRALGRKDMDTLRRSSAFGFYGGIICAAMFSLLCGIFRNPLLKLLGADDVTFQATAAYLKWTVILGAVPSITSIILSYLVRAEGASVAASVGVITGAGLNIILDPVFILPWGLNMGAEGAALATFISNTAALVFYLVYIMTHRKTTLVCISPKAFSLRRDVVAGVCGVGIPASIQNLLNVTSHTLLNNLAAPFGAAALAGMGIASKISQVPMNLAMGINQGIMPLVSYNYSAKNTGRMKKVLSFTTMLDVILLCSACALCIIARNPLVRLFIDNGETVALGGKFMIGLSLSVPFMGVDFLSVNVFQAVGKGKLSLVMAFCRKILFEIPALIVLNHLLPLTGLSYAQLVSEFMMTIVGGTLLLRFIHEADRNVSKL